MNGEKRIELFDYTRIDADTIAVDGMLYKRAADGVCRPTGEKAPVKVGAVDDAADALAEVNAQRAMRGQYPFANDEGLTIAARLAARFRAVHRIHGHVMQGAGDFQFVPQGTVARAAGCAVRAPQEPFDACCVRDNYRACGAATAIGDDGQKYCHVFVRRVDSNRVERFTIRCR